MRLAAAFALAAIAAASCSRSSPPATASATESQAVRGAPETVILQASDVPADYVLETDDVMTAQQLADGLSTSTKALEGAGRVGLRPGLQAVRPAVPVLPGG